MTRQDIESQYNVVDGVIRSPGKFEGEPVYAPYFWDAMLNDDGNYLTDEITEFDILPDDIEQFPELRGHKRIQLVCADNGFVYASLD